ncbi:hypothetical protein Calhy_0332 [Caldicellulosiruptor hydrothermalis 108]|uniref:Uncharacterized protein n=1 Tax=Caldicellulosiruptor hydrothermalis (strain DSM 18901 / VKM B-2411 / 108) TaxID=632292 RepID=E4QBH8_CALH1|nr:hypothetical protein [Caldicellulosiruptor hydrothermalis]ADQ06080.1 hypothetical protein Calhy_0332 [Caldicellulosiruptor hydrothermalis 108]
MARGIGIYDATSWADETDIISIVAETLWDAYFGREKYAYAYYDRSDNAIKTESADNIKEAIKQAAKDGNVILFVASKKTAQSAVREDIVNIFVQVHGITALLDKRQTEEMYYSCFSIFAECLLKKNKGQLEKDIRRRLGKAIMVK